MNKRSTSHLNRKVVMYTIDRGPPKRELLTLDCNHTIIRAVRGSRRKYIVCTECPDVQERKIDILLV